MVKGIAIFLMVSGHSIEYGGKSSYLAEVLFLLIYSFHMPLFALVSGYLFFPSVSSKNPVSIFIKQAKRYIVPIISWTAVHSVLCLCTGAKLDARGYVLYNLWFLWAMFLCSLAVLAARKFFNDSVIFYAFLFVALLFAPMAATAVFMYPYFVIGYLWHRENFDVKIKSLWDKHKITITICFIISWLFLFQFYTVNSEVYVTKIYLLSGKMTVPEQFGLDIYRWATGLAGSLAAMSLIKFIRPVKFLCIAGANSMGIYVISRLIGGYFMSAGGIPLKFIQAAIVTAVCCILSMIISRNKILNQLLLGGR